MRHLCRVILLASVVICTGCGTLPPPQRSQQDGSGSAFRRFVSAIFTRAAMNSLQFDGVVDEQHDIALELANSARPEIARGLNLAINLGLIEQSGPRLLHLRLEGGGDAWVVSRLQMSVQVAGLKSDQPVRVYVRPLGLGTVVLYQLDRLVER